MMGPMDRRGFLKGSLVAGGGLWLAGHLGGLTPAAAAATPPRSAATGLPYVPNPLFPDGIASGDPRPDGAVLWTRVDPALDAGAGVPVAFEVATAPDLAPGSVVASGALTALAADDHTVRVDLTGLVPDTIHWYRFSTGGSDSPIGRTRTTPVPGAATGPVRFGFFSCQRWTHGYYTAHHDLAEAALDPATDLAFVLALGDYVYESGTADGFEVRPDPVGDVTDLAGFRAKYHLYRSDLNLQAVHANHCVLAIFDNHDGMGDPADAQGPAAVAAFFEQLPVRRAAPGSTRQHRRLTWGDRLDLFLLDERQYRDPAPAEDPNGLLGTHTDFAPSVFAPGRTMLGSAQRSWLLDGLTTSAAQWKVIGSQQQFWPWRTEAGPDEPTPARPHPGRYLNLGQWDGYMWERDQILGAVESAGVRDVVLVSGDNHLFSAAELSADFDDCDREPVLVEFNGASISSSNADERGLPETPITRPLLSNVNPFLRYFDGERHGWSSMAVDGSGADVAYRSPRTKDQPTSTSETLVAFRVEAGTSRIDHVSGAGFSADQGCDPAAGPVAGDPTFTG